jgi:hypothetical protein
MTEEQKGQNEQDSNPKFQIQICSQGLIHIVVTQGRSEWTKKISCKEAVRLNWFSSPHLDLQRIGLEHYCQLFITDEDVVHSLDQHFYQAIFGASERLGLKLRIPLKQFEVTQKPVQVTLVNVCDTVHAIREKVHQIAMFVKVRDVEPFLAKSQYFYIPLTLAYFEKNVSKLIDLKPKMQF